MIAKFKNEHKDEGDSKLSVKPLLESCNVTSHAIARECDSPVSNELFGPIWDNIDSNDVTGSKERACNTVLGPALNKITSEHGVTLS